MSADDAELIFIVRDYLMISRQQHWVIGSGKGDSKPDLLASHTLASQIKYEVIDLEVKSQVNNLQVQAKSRVIYLNSKSSQNGRLVSDSVTRIHHSP